MNAPKKYNIAFGGLGEGVHHYEFEVDDRFFETFEGSEILGGKATAKVVLEKGARAMVLNFDIEGEVRVECDRCLEECTLPVDFEGELAVKFTNEELPQGEEYDGEVLWLKRGEGELNVAQYIYESIVLSLPYQRVHPLDGNGQPMCNPDMLSRFSIVTQEEFDRLAAEEQRGMEGDPEWEKLRKLKENL